MKTNKKVIATCIYCSNAPNGEEHWLNRSLGTFQGNTYLTERICTPCNVELGRTIDLELARTAHTGMTRQVIGIEGRSSHEKKNVFEYKASNAEPPIQLFRIAGDQMQPIFQDAFARTDDGTLLAMEGRVLVVETSDGKRTIRFPRTWRAPQLRAAAESQGLLGGKPVSAHIPPPETIDEFTATSRDTIREVFGQFAIDIYQTNPNDLAGPVERTLIRFNLSPLFHRDVAKVAFHYFLWANPRIGGDETEFSAIRQFIRHGIGDPRDFLQQSPSLVDRISGDGSVKDCHVFAAFSRDPDLLAQVHFFAQPTGPEFPTFVVRLGSRPATLSAKWHRAHAAVYVSGIEGHDGILRELHTESPN